jgi:hypothetical protein
MKGFQWHRLSNGEIPPNGILNIKLAVPGGIEQNSTIYICRANVEGDLVPGKLVVNIIIIFSQD